MFKQVDTDGDGQVTKQQIKQVKYLKPKSIGFVYVDILLTLADPDEDDIINELDLVQANCVDAKEGSEAFLEAAIKVLDKDGSGGLDQQELSQVYIYNATPYFRTPKWQIRPVQEGDEHSSSSTFITKDQDGNGEL